MNFDSHAKNNALTPAQWAAVDRNAWEAICRWPSYADFDPVHDGLDFGELTRWFLWDKVARSVRHDIDPAAFRREARSMGWQDSNRLRRASSRPSPARRIARRIRASLSKGKNAAAARFQAEDTRSSSRSERRILFLPTPSPRLVATAQGLLRDGTLRVVAPESKAEFPGVERVHYPKNLRKPDEAFGERLCSAIVLGLSQQGIDLFEQDRETLRQEISKQQQQLQAARGYIDSLKPDAMLVHADNHPPHQHFVLLGRTYGIPSIMLQHGLDCEHFYLDHAYADAIAVWSPNRADRYRCDSTYQPERIAITGNPEFDRRSFAEALDTSGSYWLWVTRPHSSAKCYSPSRSPMEGVMILEGLFAALRDCADATLVIKAHPYDASDLYTKAIEDAGMSDRVRLVDTPPHELFQEASVVITEDTTAGMEAMFDGKIIVHAHFAPTDPTVDYVGYGAALAGRSQEQLRESLRNVAHLSRAGRDDMHRAQHKFLHDHAGPCDGRAEERVRSFILKVLEAG